MHSIHPIICSVCLLFGLTVMTALKPGSSPAGDCYKVYEEIMQLYQRYQGDKGYMKFRSYSIVNKQQGEKLETEFWKYHEKVLYRNELVALYQDAGTQVMILKNTRSILLRNADATSVPVPDFGTYHRDSLDKMVQTLTCSDGSLSMELRSAYAQHSGISKVVLEYNPSKKLLQKGIYNFTHEKRTDVYEYLIYKEDAGEPFAGSALSVVFGPDNKVRPAYSGFQIKDLR